MPGTFILKPIEAHIHGENDLKFNRNAMDAYCKVKIGDQKYITHPSQQHGVHPTWNEDLVIQQGEKSRAKLVLKDKHNEKKIGKVKFDLNEVREKGKINRWFDIYKHNQVQGKIHLDMIYTCGNPQSKSFHQSIKEGTAVASNSNYIPNLSDLERFQRHSEVESTKFMLSSGMSNPNIAMLGVNHNIGHTNNHGFGHHDNTRERLGPNGEVDLRYTNDATLRDLKLTGNPANTGMSNPNTAKLGINHKEGPFGVKNLYNENYEVQKHLPVTDNAPKDATNNHSFGRHDNTRERLGPNGEVDLRYTKDATLKDLKLTGNPANTGMSNPNTAKLGINHKEGPFGVKNIYNENYEAQKHLPAIENAPRVVTHSPQKKTSNLSNVSLNEGSSKLRSSNPNTLGLGDENLRGLRKSSYNDVPSNKYLGDPYDVGTHNNTRRPHRKSEDLGFGGTEMSNPNNAKYHVNQNIGHTGPTNFHNNIAVKEQLGPIDPHGDAQRLSSRMSERSSFSGMSNPNNAGIRRYY